MPIRAEVGLEMVLNMGERREERRLWRLGGIMGVFLVVFVWDMRIWTNARDRDERRQQEERRRRKKITNHTSCSPRGLLESRSLA